jgi:hypothetical protein
MRIHFSQRIGKIAETGLAGELRVRRLGKSDKSKRRLPGIRGRSVGGSEMAELEDRIL